MYRTGRGVAEDHGEALVWYRMAADQGYSAALYSLGLMYETGAGVTADVDEALTWYRRAAAEGFAPAQSNFGLMYYQGNGVAEDYGEALSWLLKAAEQDHAAAQFNLGLLYVQDRAVPRDLVQAHFWWSLAAGQGIAQAAAYRDGVAADMTAAQISEAQELARAWRTEHDARAAASIAPAAAAPPDFDAGKQAYQRGDYRAALIAWRPLAEHGDARAQFSLGVMTPKARASSKTMARRWRGT